ncbi:MAG: hypothetical protein QXS54_07330 [Candidatus Methanomethylicaceae archaeon]
MLPFLFHMGKQERSAMPKGIQGFRILGWGGALLFLLLLGQATNPSTCLAQGSRPQPAAYGRQPYPNELVDAFEQAGTNRLGNNGPDLPKIWKGYPPAQAKLVSPYVPCILLRAIGYTESTDWKQFNADYGQYGYTVISSDCGYGIMQITSGMGGGAGFDPTRVAAEPADNIGTGALFLIQKWNGLNVYIGNNNPYVVEDWYYAVWAYNGWGWVNNPNRNCPADNPDCGYAFNPFRPPFDGTQPRRWYPYQEIVWGYAAHPPGPEFWTAVPLTLPPRASITNPPPTHIDTPQPSHGSCSVVYLPAVLKDYPPCVQPIQNGDFEAGSTYWTLGGRTLISTLIPHSGSYSAWLGGYNNANDTLYQTITIPNTGPTGRPVIDARLSYYWYMSTEETSTSNDYDFLYVRIRNVYGSTLRQIQVVTNRSARGAWMFASFDVSEFIGQTVQIHFQSTTDGSFKSSFFIDDVNLYACEGG